MMMNLPTASSVDTEDLSILVQELKELGFDAIRFASYRTAAKLRYIQKKSNFLLVDLWNVLEGFRENGLNGLDPYSIITVPKLEGLVTSLFHNLNKRLPLSEQVDVLSCGRYLLSWLLIAYDGEGSGRVRNFSVKVSLVTLCNGKLVDKLRYIFSLISDASGVIVPSRFSEYLQEVLALPTMVLEAQTFGFTEGLGATIFDGTSKVTVNTFLDVLFSDPGPPCLMWLPLLAALASVEDLSHNVSCSICSVRNILGFRYKCQKCSNFNMCQTCFWQGKTKGNHKTEHEVKEYATTSKSSGKGLRSSFRKSLRCVPDKKKVSVPRFPEEPERCLNLSHIVPPSPLPLHNGFPCGYEDAFTDQKMFALDLVGPSRMTNSYHGESVSESEEEHRLIARYSARLASDNKFPNSRSMSQSSVGSAMAFQSQSQRDMIAQLETRNKEIMKEIARLKEQQELDYMNGEGVNPVVMDELRELRTYKLDLEDKLNGLQDSRRHLMGQLEGLMRLLKAQQLSPSEGPEGERTLQPFYSHSQPGSLQRNHSHNHNYDFSSDSYRERSNSNYEDDLRVAENEFQDQLALEASSQNQQLRNDLLLAADSVTNAMSSLVKELNSEEGQQGQENGGRAMKPLEFEASSSDAFKSTRWKKDVEARLKEEERLLMDLRMQKLSSNPNSGHGHGHGHYASIKANGNGNGAIGNGRISNSNGGTDHYDRRSESLGRRRRSYGEEPLYAKPHRVGNGNGNGRINNAEGVGVAMTAAEWEREEGLQRRVNN